MVFQLMLMMLVGGLKGPALGERTQKGFPADADDARWVLG